MICFQLLGKYCEKLRFTCETNNNEVTMYQTHCDFFKNDRDPPYLKIRDCVFKKTSTTKIYKFKCRYIHYMWNTVWLDSNH